MKRMIALLVLALTACGNFVPANAPGLLEATPGPGVMVTDYHFENELLVVEYPRGWQVTTPATFSSPWVVFTHPDGVAVMTLTIDPWSVQTLPASVPPEQVVRLERQIERADGSPLLVVLAVSAESAAEFGLILDQVADAVQLKMQ